MFPFDDVIMSHEFVWERNPDMKNGLCPHYADAPEKTARIKSIIKSMMTSWNGNISALLAFCAGNSSVTCECPAQRPVRRRFDVFLDLRLNKRFSKQWRRWWFQTPSCSSWRHCNALELPTHRNESYTPDFYQHGFTVIQAWISKYILLTVWWNYLFIHKLQRRNRWSLRMDW